MTKRKRWRTGDRLVNGNAEAIVVDEVKHNRQTFLAIEIEDGDCKTIATVTQEMLQNYGWEKDEGEYFRSGCQGDRV